MDAFLAGSLKPSISKDNQKKTGLSNASSHVRRNQFKPWVEKYRPDRMEEVAYQEEVVAVLKTSVIKLDLPNLLFYGPPGTGKTSTILAAGRELFGDMYRDRILELNASDERGIGVIREKVKNFAQLSASSIRPDGKLCPPFKIVVLDEADSMTTAAQAALRRTMETESKTTRFCLICNYVTRIIEPITSRCAKFRFKPLSEDVLLLKLKVICEKESVSCDDEALKALIETSEGDMRKAITTLQSASRLYSSERSITRTDIIEISGVVNDDVIKSLLEVCCTVSQEKVDTAVKDLMAEGHSAYQVLLQLHDIIVLSDELNDKQKSAICERVAIADKRLVDGADEYLQIMDVCRTILQQIRQAA